MHSTGNLRLAYLRGGKAHDHKAHSACAQALFRKIAAALPGMESLSAAKQEDLVDVNLSPASAKAGAGSGASSCAC